MWRRHFRARIKIESEFLTQIFFFNNGYNNVCAWINLLFLSLSGLVIRAASSDKIGLEKYHKVWKNLLFNLSLSIRNRKAQVRRQGSSLRGYRKQRLLAKFFAQIIFANMQLDNAV